MKIKSAPILVRLLTYLAIAAFWLFMVRLGLFWTNVLPSFGIPISSNIVTQWVLTFFLDSFALLYGNHLQNQYRLGRTPPQVANLIVWVLVIILGYQIASILFHSLAGLVFNYLSS